MTDLTEDLVEEMLDRPRALLYKHSPACWLSSRAARTVGRVGEEHPELPIYVVDVLGQRGLSRDLAARLDVPHASPQVILLRQGKAVWDASHLGVTHGGLSRVLDPDGA